jgi:DNA-binding CsgD family transcriptional regulator
LSALQNNPFTYLLERLRRAFRSSRLARRSFDLDQELIQALQMLAEQEQRPAEDLAFDLLAFAIDQKHASQVLVQRWRTLSLRQQQVAALACLNLTNRQIAARLMISPETVKTHLRNALYKFEVHSKIELRLLLSDWDFSAWDKATQHNRSQAD